MPSKHRFFYGVRVQILATSDGIPLEFCILPGACSDLQGLAELALDLPKLAQLFEQPESATDKPRSWTMRGKVRELAENGLQATGTRHEAQFILLLDFWRQNYFEDAAASFVKNWIREKHNGFSKAARAQNWRETDRKIDRQATYIWAMPKTLPDSTHNLHGEVTTDDLIFSAKLFPKDAVRQKQFFKLTSFCRPRKHHDWIFISHRIWTEEIASKRTFEQFQNELKTRGIMRSINHGKPAVGVEPPTIIPPSQN